MIEKELGQAISLHPFNSGCYDASTLGARHGIGICADAPHSILGKHL